MNDSSIINNLNIHILFQINRSNLLWPTVQKYLNYFVDNKKWYSLTSRFLFQIVKKNKCWRSDTPAVQPKQPNKKSLEGWRLRQVWNVFFSAFLTTLGYARDYFYRVLPHSASIFTKCSPCNRYVANLTMVVGSKENTDSWILRNCL